MNDAYSYDACGHDTWSSYDACVYDANLYDAHIYDPSSWSRCMHVSMMHKSMIRLKFCSKWTYRRTDGQGDSKRRIQIDFSANRQLFHTIILRSFKQNSCSSKYFKSKKKIWTPPAGVAELKELKGSEQLARVLAASVNLKTNFYQNDCIVI